MDYHILATCPVDGPFQTGAIVEDNGGSIVMDQTTSTCPTCRADVLIPDGEYRAGPFGLQFTPA